jgi:hypothetical protein
MGQWFVLECKDAALVLHISIRPCKGIHVPGREQMLGRNALLWQFGLASSLQSNNAFSPPLRPLAGTGMGQAPVARLRWLRDGPARWTRMVTEGPGLRPGCRWRRLEPEIHKDAASGARWQAAAAAAGTQLPVGAFWAPAGHT